jgi:hypothetical protein
VEVIAFTDIDWDPESVAQRLRVSERDLARRLIDSAKAALAPKVAFRISYLDEKRDGGVVVDGIGFNSRVLPRKSVSGIYFPTEVSFFSCQLCPRERCEGRKARYDKQKAREYGVLKE